MLDRRDAGVFKLEAGDAGVSELELLHNAHVFWRMSNDIIAARTSAAHATATLPTITAPRSNPHQVTI
jgi:hypothetical protein